MDNWKNIKGYEGIYQINEYGLIKRLANSDRCSSDRLVKHKYKKNGYAFVCLSVNSKCKYFHVHRLVAIAFIENTYNKSQINHKDLNKTNNHISNLEWVTAKENNTHARTNIKFKNGLKKGILNNLSYQIAQLINNEIVYVWDSVYSISEHYNIVGSAILKSCRFNSKSIGYNWKKISKKDYYDLVRLNTDIPPILINKRYRDLSMAIKAKKEKNEHKFTNDYLINHGVKCFLKYGNLFRINYDVYAKENNTLTYIPVSNRFNGFPKFKEIVLNKLQNIQIQL
jgi:hypothetical protein